ncbi:hypothetical protein K1T71_011325 [Dendrolimus kikuchii]|uniref:Uncharacterized protein n=1 Tax=Dendrolimus kikuchii TaxID=765133 RepID=A0ACC1CNF5_9NEOP|nr:hypothetical protein K1T71_011325 [Dendrolimus kikuchii]
MDLESFQNYVTKDILPLEYGGKENSIKELHNDLIQVLSSKEHVEHVKEMNKAKTDESKRIFDTFNERLKIKK